MPSRNTILFAISVFFLNGCKMIDDNIHSSSSIDTNSDTLIIVKIQSEQLDINFATLGMRALKDNGTLTNPVSASSYYGNTFGENGYFIFKLNKKLAGSEYIAFASLVQDNGENPPKYQHGYAYCGKESTEIAFNVNEPGVFYLGDFSFSEYGNKTYGRVENNLDALKNYLKHSYPNIPYESVRYFETDFMPTEKRCPGATVISI